MQLSSDMFYRCLHFKYSTVNNFFWQILYFPICPLACLLTIESKMLLQSSSSAATWTVFNLLVGMTAEKELLLSSEVIGKRSTSHHLTRSS